MTDDKQFRALVWGHYHTHGRDLPWRSDPLDAYRILVSEFMLQQTQVSRVIPKYVSFLHQFPSLSALAQASLADVIRAWSGLGYNRRAKYLQEAAKQLSSVDEPWTIENLTACTGIGFNTAAAVLTYAYNQPIAYIETNVRTVYIHHFFPNATGSHPVADAELLPIIQRTMDYENPREFMWALMDYGSFLKSSVGNVSRLSKQHSVQSRFEGSRRQVRGEVLRQLHAKQVNMAQLQAMVQDIRLDQVLIELVGEGLVQQSGDFYKLSD